MSHDHDRAERAKNSRTPTLKETETTPYSRCCDQQQGHGSGVARRRARLVIVDLRELTFMDGFSVIVKADERARSSGRRLVLVRGPHQILRLLTLIGIADRLEIVDLQSRPAPTKTLATRRP